MLIRPSSMILFFMMYTQMPTTTLKKRLMKALQLLKMERNTMEEQIGM